MMTRRPIQAFELVFSFLILFYMAQASERGIFDSTHLHWRWHIPLVLFNFGRISLLTFSCMVHAA